jgi:signal transduction histidine kinase
VTPSLHQRILIGSILWTVGMIVIASAVFTVMVERSPGVRLTIAQHVHGGLQSSVVVLSAVLCLAGGALLVRRGLSRLHDLRSRLAGLHQSGGRLAGEYPREVQPLVDDLNALLDHRDQALRRAVARAGDLAHGLKTPLAILAREAEGAGAAGQTAIAEAICEQVERMRRHVDYHLAHARAAAAGSTPGIRASVRESADGLVRALLRLYADQGIQIGVDAAAALDVRAQREDLDEMLGNILDNACKWARSRIHLSCAAQDGHVVTIVDDDGAGLAEDMRSAVLERGVRADETTRGTGLGLAIVRDLAELYGGSIALDRSPAGGCRAVLRLPRA